MYKVFLNEDNIIEIYNEAGPKTPEEQAETITQVKKLGDQLRGEGKPILIFDDISKMDLPSEQLRKVGSTVEKLLDLDKFALFTTDVQMKIIVKFMIEAGEVLKSKVFNNKEEAIVWLKS